MGSYDGSAAQRGKTGKTYNKHINLASAAYDGMPVRCWGLLQGKLALTPPPQLRITASGILDTMGRPLDGNRDGQPGGDYVALLTGGGAQPQIVRGAKTSFAVHFDSRPGLDWNLKSHASRPL